MTAMNQTKFFAVALRPDSEFARLEPPLLSLVPECVRRKTHAFAVPAAAQANLLGEVLARHVIREAGIGISPDTPFETGEKGKPCPDGYRGAHFNISHSGDWVVAALSPDRVGVDIERVRPVKPGLAERFFSATENRMLAGIADEAGRRDLFFTLWTLKESFLKAVGTGLSGGLKSFSVEAAGDGRFALASDPETHGWRLETRDFAQGYKLAACARRPGFAEQVRIVRQEEFL